MKSSFALALLFATTCFAATAFAADDADLFRAATAHACQFSPGASVASSLLTALGSVVVAFAAGRRIGRR
jgi:hypothetical protein